MFKSKSRWQLGVGLLFVVLTATACFRSVGDVPQGNVVSERSTETNTPIPTPIPTEEEPTVVDQPISDVDTSTPTPTNTSTPTSIPASSALGTEVAQSGEGGDTPTPDIFRLTSAALIEQATSVVETQQAATDQASGVGIITDEPTFTPTIDPLILTLTATSLAPINVDTGPTLTGADCVHEVRAGENLYRISTIFYGLPVNTVAARNGIVNINLISIGQRLVIPGCGTTGFFPPPTSTPIPVPTTFGTGGAFVTQDPGTGGGFATTVPVSTSVCGSQYLIQQYDTLFQISLRCNVPVASIAAANGIANINYIKMGDTLTIPPG